MKDCKQCGKEAPGRNQFCSHSCSAKYNNSRRIRTPWTEEQHIKIRKQKYCKYCKKELREGKVCSECTPYLNYGGYLIRMGFIQGTLKERYNKLVSEIIYYYFDEKESLDQVAARFGITRDTVRRYLKLEGKKSRTFGEAVKVAILQGRRDLSEPDPIKYKYISGHHITWEGKTIYYRSSYELEYALQLDEQRISYDVECIRIKYYDTQKRDSRVAVPDFYLLNTNEIVEIKSSYTYDEQNMKDKFKAYVEAGYIPKLILDKKEKAL